MSTIDDGNLATEEPTPPQEVPRRSRRRLWLSVLIVVLAVTVIAVGYTVVRLLVDSGTYDDGHEAYQRGDCTTAVNKYDSVINGWRLVTLGDTVSRAEAEKAECLPFQDAAERQRSGNTSGAVTAYAKFVTDRPKSPLTDTARGRITELFTKTDLANLVTVESCDALPMLSEANMLSSAAPGFYAACGTAYLHVANWDQATKTYSRLFSKFGQDKVATDTATALAGDTGWCVQLSRIRADPVLAGYGDLFPGLLSACAKASTTSELEAIKDAEEFLRKFPGHRLTGEVTGSYAQLINKRVRADTRAKNLGGVELSGTVAGDKAVILLYNDSPELLRFTLAGGPEPRVEEVAACPSCPDLVNATDRSVCRDQATMKRIVIAPGEYDFAADRPQPLTSPTVILGNEHWVGGYGHWSLKPGKQYFSCIAFNKPGD